MSKKMLTLEKLIDQIQCIKSEACLTRLQELEEDLLEIERKEIMEALKAEKRQKSTVVPEESKIDCEEPPAKVKTPVKE